MEQAEKRVWLGVILSAIEDLDNDTFDGTISTVYGEKFPYCVKSDAIEFLSGRNKGLYRICKAIDLNANVIVNALKVLGPSRLKEKFFAAKGKENDTKQLQSR